VAEYLQRAADAGAELALLPENFASMGGSDAEKRCMAAEADALLDFLAAQAATHHLHIIGGSLLIAREQGITNSLPVFDNRGALLACYDKMHLFDMDLNGERYAESDLIAAGEQPVIVELAGFRIGLSICYDLRFPELYRHYSAAGCDLLCNVAAFTATTGRAHWRTLLTARAIENQCYMLAAAQCGEHPDGRHTWGQSMVIDPWGEVIGKQGDGAGVVIASISCSRLRAIRQQLPALRHRRM